MTITGDRIVGISPAGTGGSARRVINADGRVLSPGFIDLHAHSDVQILVDHDHLAKVSQGVTCEVLGQDGLSYAPADEVTSHVLRQQLAGWNGDPDVPLGWPGVADYLDAWTAGSPAMRRIWCRRAPYGCWWWATTTGPRRPPSARGWPQWSGRVWSTARSG